MVNISELLKDAPKGMKLYSPLFGEVRLVCVNCDNNILVETEMHDSHYFAYNGVFRMSGCYPNSECLLFPSKDCRTWEEWKVNTCKFKVLDWIVRNDGSSIVPIQVYGLKKDRYLVTNMLGSKGELMINRQDEWHLWTIQDAIDGDVLACSDWLFILKQFNVKGNQHKTYCHYDLTLNRFKDDTDSYMVSGSDEFHPANKEQCDLLFAKMREAGYQWDEKQKELKLLITNGGDFFEPENCEQKSEPKFKVGDWLYPNCNGIYPVLVTDYNKCCGYQLQEGSDRCHLSTKIVEDKYHLWTIADTKDGDVLTLNGKPFIYSHKYEKNYCYIDDCGQFRVNFSLVLEGNCVCPATKQERDLLFSKMREVGYEWDKKKKELKKIPVKPKFKVGDTIQYKDNTYKIIGIHYDTRHYLVDGGTIGFAVQDCYHLWSIADAKDGDILSAKIDGDNYILIFKQIKDGWVETYGHYYITIDKFCTPTQMFCRDYQGTLYPATQEERDMLFAKLREAGYTWDAGKKEIKRSIKPKFKLHDIIMRKGDLYSARTIMYVNNEKMTYGCSHGKDIPFSEQDLWHLSNSHYFIQYFKPKQWVLVRNCDNQTWCLSIFSHMDMGFYVCINREDFRQCIPLEGNEKLLGTTDMCPEEYINW